MADLLPADRLSFLAGDRIERKRIGALTVEGHDLIREVAESPPGHRRGRERALAAAVATADDDAAPVIADRRGMQPRQLGALVDEPTDDPIQMRRSYPSLPIRSRVWNLLGR